LQYLPLQVQMQMLQALRSLRLSRLQWMLRSVPVRALSPWLLRALTP
jgi:hypothetical protein